MKQAMRECYGDDAPLPTIGPAEGTVIGANRATSVVQPSALAQEVPIQITGINAASANLLAGAERVGEGTRAGQLRPIRVHALTEGGDRDPSLSRRQPCSEGRAS